MIIQRIEKVNAGLSHNLLKEIIAAITRHVNPSKIFLFGSRAQGRYSSTSDIDIAVDCGDDDFLIQPIDEEVRTLLKLDIINFYKVNEKLQKEIMTDGIILYEKT